MPGSKPLSRPRVPVIVVPVRIWPGDVLASQALLGLAATGIT
jgi:hypothetical protein